MPKRSHKNEDSDSEDYLRRKIQKIERKIAKRRNRLRNRSESTSSSSAMIIPVQSEQEDEFDVRSEVHVLPNAEGGSHRGTPSSPTQATVSEAQPIEVPSQIQPDEPELDDEIKDLLGETPSKDKKYGADIRGELAVRWEHIATTGLSKDSKKELLGKHLVPKNCTKIDAPKLNPEIKAALSEMLVKKDKALENKQLQLAASISCISEALTRLLTLEQKDQTVIKLLIEAGRLMCDSQHNESMTRRNFICSTIKKDIKDQISNTEIDSFLFGEKLADTLKAAKAISKSGAEIKITPAKKITLTQKNKHSFQNLNQKPPLPAARQAGAARRFEPTPSTARQRQPQQSRQPTRSYHPAGPRRR